MDANQALLLSTVGVSAIYALFSYVIILRITSRSGVSGGVSGGSTGAGSPVPAPTPDPVPAPAPAPVDRFPAAIADTLEWEGGNDDDPRDPGGRTSRGILQREWNVWRQTHPGLPSDVWEAPQDQVLAIYRQNYWEAMSCGELPAGVDYCVFDYGVNSGNSRAAKALQQLVKVNADGEIGPDTIAAAAKADPATLIHDLCDQRLAFLEGLGTWSTFGKGWTNRVEGVREQALAMLKGLGPAPAPGTIPVQLSTMRDLVARGVHATHDNPEIMTWPGFIAMKFSNVVGLGDYCAGYTHDSIAWCGLTMAFCMAKAGIAPPFVKGDDLKSFLWAFGWMDSGWGTTVWRYDQGPISDAPAPQPGDILVFDWSYTGGARTNPGQGHVTMYDHLSPNDDKFWCSGGNQGNHLCSTAQEPMRNCVAIIRPPA